MQVRYRTNPYDIPYYTLYLGAAMGDLLFKLKGAEKKDLKLTSSDVELFEGTFSIS
jgi:hypothetical protein